MSPKNKTHLAVLVAIAAIGPTYAAEQSAPASDKQSTSQPAARQLDLRIPNITSLYTQEQIAVFLAKTRSDDDEEVEVEGRREPRRSVTPDVWGGIATPVWAVLHPTQAWRIFAPLPPDQVRRMQNQKPDATNPYRATAARSAADP